MSAYSKKFLFTSLFSVFIATISVGYCADQKKEFYFMGGGGAPAGKNTIFDSSIKNISSFVNHSNWKSTVSFNGGHAETEKIIQEKLGKAKNLGPFDLKNYNALMDDIINKLRSNQYKPGSQIMIAIDTHGAKRRAGASVEKTHRVALSNGEAQELTNLSGANLVDLDKLDTLAELASAKDVKLAVADLSCYSGNLLNIKNEKVCLISGTGPEHYSYTSAATDLAVSKNTPTTSFSGRFLESFKKGKNLEELFLAARDSSSNSFDSPDFPMINTEDGLAVNDMIYKLITPYLKYDSTRITNFTPQYAETSKEFEEQVCSINNNHELLIGLLKQYEKIEDISKFMGVNGYDFKSLRNALGEYRKYQIKFEESVRGKFEVDNEIKAMLEEKFPNDKDLWSKYRPSAYIITDSDQSLKYYEDLAADEIKKNRDAGAWRAMVAQLKRQKVIAAYVRANLNKSAQQKLKKAEDAYRETSVTLKLANNVSKEAKKVFTKLYKSVKRPKGNPCREFVL